MRFRAKLVNYVSIQQITRVVQTVARISKSCTLILSPSHVVLVFNDSATKGNVCMWCEMNQSSLFEEYRIEGKDDRNEIYLDLAPDNVARVLKTSTAAEAIKIKLTKKLSPCLTFEVTLPSLTSSCRLVTHDIPVSIVPTKFWTDFKEPVCSHSSVGDLAGSLRDHNGQCLVTKMANCLSAGYLDLCQSVNIIPDINHRYSSENVSPLWKHIQVSICLPEIKLLRNILEKMKNLSSHIVIAGSREGKMSFCVDSSLVSVTTYFQDLEVLTSAGHEPAARLPSRSVDLSSAATTSSPGIVADLDSDCEMFDVKVDLRRLSQFVFGQQILPRKVVAHITHQDSLHLFVVHDDASMQYILPALNV